MKRPGGFTMPSFDQKPPFIAQCTDIATSWQPCDLPTLSIGVGVCDDATHGCGLAVPSGIVSNTGVAGLTVGGRTLEITIALLPSGAMDYLRRICWILARSWRGSSGLLK